MGQLSFLIGVVPVLKAAIAIAAVFVVCVVIHEYGHYSVAKHYGVDVPAFAIGMGPKLFKWMRKGTEFSVRLFPIGGFVQLAGEVPQDTLFRVGEKIAFELDEQDRLTVVADPRDLPHARVALLRELDLFNRLEMTLETDEGIRTYNVRPHAKLMTSVRSSMPIVAKDEQVMGKPLYQRALMILAGPFMNFVLAGVLFSAAFLHMGVPTQQPYIGQVVSGSAAAEAGLLKGDRIVSVNGVEIKGWNDLVDAIQSDKSNPPVPLNVEITRNGTNQWIKVAPRVNAGRLQLGINEAVTYNPIRAVQYGFASVYTQSVGVVQLYGQVISRHQFNDLAGPVGIADVIGQQAQAGVWQVIMITGLLSLNLGLFNLIPIPALDGGRLLFMFVELVRGRSVDPHKESLVHLVGFALLMLFAVVITYRDVTRLF